MNTKLKLRIRKASNCPEINERGKKNSFCTVEGSPKNYTRPHRFIKAIHDHINSCDKCHKGLIGKKKFIFYGLETVTDFDSMSWLFGTVSHKVPRPTLCQSD